MHEAPDLYAEERTAMRIAAGRFLPLAGSDHVSFLAGISEGLLALREVRGGAPADVRADLAARTVERDAARARVTELQGQLNIGVQHATLGVLGEVATERFAQDMKWGEQGHPDGTGPDVLSEDARDLDDAAALGHLAEWARERCDVQHHVGTGTYEQILTEEWAEAISEPDPLRLRRELIQVAAVAVAWVEKIDRGAAAEAGGL